MGGAGSLWDIILNDKKDNSKFERNVIDLINLMEKSQKLKYRVKKIRKYLQSGISSTAVKWNN